MKGSRSWFAALLVALASTLWPGSGWAQTNVTLGIPTVVGVQYSDLLFGKELGYFREEGIDLKLVGFQGSGVTIPQVVNKAVQFALTESSIVITALAKDDPLPVRFVYNHMRGNVNDFATLESGPIRTLADLKGRKLGIGSLTFASIPMTKASLKALGLTWGRDVEVRPVGVGAAAWKQLESGQVDALNLYYSEDVRMRAAGMKIRQISYPEAFQSVFAQAMMTHADTIRDNPKLVGGMLRAIAKSSTACAANREACVQTFWKFDPTSKPAPDKLEEWMRNSVTILKENWKSIGHFPDGKVRWGSFEPKILDTYIAALKDAELISRTDLPLDRIYTNAFVEEANKFDREAVERQAKAVAVEK